MGSFYKAHTFEQLSHSLCEQLSAATLNDPLSSEWIVVQSIPQAAYLKLQFARTRGFSGNWNTLLPSELFWKLFRMQYPDTPKNMPLDLSAIKWRIFELLQESAELRTTYSIKEPDSLFEMQCYALSSQLAATFDQYQVFRPSMLRDWERGVPAGLAAGQRETVAAQAEIWSRLCKRIDTFPKSRAEAMLHYLSLPPKEILSRSNLPKRISVFGLSEPSRPFLELLAFLDSLIEVNYFHLDSISNPAVKSLAEGLELYDDELSLSANILIEENQFRLIEADKEEPAYSPHRRENTGIETANPPEVSFASCHSPRREIQELKEAVLDYLSASDSASADQILILVPSVDVYVPLISEIFEDSNDIHLKVSVPGSFTNENIRIKHSFLKLLALFGGRFSIEEVLDVLMLPDILTTAGISQKDVEILRELIVEQNVRWGLNASHKSENNGFETPLYTWEKAADEWMMGALIQSEFPNVELGYIPAEGIEGMDAFRRAACAYSFIQKLIKFEKMLSGKKSVEEWGDSLKSLIYAFFNPSEHKNYATIALLQSLDSYLDAAGMSGCTAPVSFELIRLEMEKLCSPDTSQNGSFGRGILVSTYRPLQAVPFSFVAVLGLNDGTFPRKPVKPEYDLISIDRKPGERDATRSDQNLFLSIYASTREKLYLSYIGKDERNNELQMPSTTILAFQDILAQSRRQEPSVREHALQAFSRRYFLNDEAKFSKKAALTAEKLYAAKSQPKPFLPEQYSFEIPKYVSLKEIQQFFKNPAEWILKYKLGAKPAYRHKIPNSRDILRKESLEDYQLKKLVSERITEYPIEQIGNYVKSAGYLPEGSGGAKEWDRLTIAVTQAFEDLKQLTQSGEMASVNVSDEYQGIKINGSVSLSGDNPVFFFFSEKIKPKYEIEAYIAHLFYQAASGTFSDSYICCIGKSSAAFTRIMAVEDASAEMAGLLDWYKEAHTSREKLKFFPETSEAYHKAFLKDGNHENALQTALKKWEPNEYSMTESVNESVQIVFREEKQVLTDEFVQNAKAFWGLCKKRMVRVRL